MPRRNGGDAMGPGDRPLAAHAGGDDELVLLEAWESAQRAPGWLRPLALAAALDGGPALHDQPLGAVAARLLALTRRWIGERLDGVVACPRCGEQLAVELPVAALLASGADDDAAQPVAVHGDGWRVSARLPTPADLAAATREPDVERARARLLARLVVAAEPADALADPATAAAVEAALDAEFEARDPLGAITVTVSCPACGAADSAGVDVVTWWSALADARVQRVMHDVHRLARAYGWSERESLEVGPYRRARYLELVS